jgi:hypothetical protein
VTRVRRRERHNDITFEQVRGFFSLGSVREVELGKQMRKCVRRHQQRPPLREGMDDTHRQLYVELGGFEYNACRRLPFQSLPRQPEVIHAGDIQRLRTCVDHSEDAQEEFSDIRAAE